MEGGVDTANDLRNAAVRNVGLDRLVLLARGSEEGEMYETREETADFRIRVGARIAPSGTPIFLLEVVIYPCRHGTKVAAGLLERRWRLVKDLEGLGYAMACQEDGYMMGEKQFPRSELSVRMHALSSAVSERLGRRDL